MFRTGLIWLCLGVGVMIQSSVTPDDIINSVLTHHPKIKIQQSKKLSREGELLSSKGAFDTELNLKSNIRSLGYYDGNVSEMTLTQPLPILNAHLYAGYRKSEGDFPVYEDEYVTNSDGESMLGISVSLLGNGEINKAILESNMAKIDVDIANEYLTLEEIKMMNTALTYYWKCIYYAQVAYAYQHLYQAAVKRQEGIKRRVEAGDLPQTYLLENQRTLHQREADYIIANQSFHIMANNLSLYYRNESGLPVVLRADQLPSHFETVSDVEAFDTVLTQLLETHPLLVQIRLERKQLDYELSFETQQNLPKINVGYEYSDDYGDGADSRDQKESKVKASLKMPLQRRKATGKITGINEKLNQLNLLEKWVEDQLRVELKEHIISIEALQKSIHNRKEALTLAAQLFESENIRLESGDSDFFQLNTSEQNLIRSTLSYLKDALDLNLHVVDYTMLYF